MTMNKSNKELISILVSVFFSISIFAQQKGLLISEILTNPNGNDSPFEYVELLATTNINFATTPYSIVLLIMELPLQTDGKQEVQ